MIHPDLEEVAELLASGAFRASGAEGVDGLAESLYVWYLNATPLPKPAGPLLPQELDLPAALRTAHHRADRYEGGWRADSVSTFGRVAARKGTTLRVLERSEYTVPGRSGLRAQPGDALVASHCWDWIDEQTGYWHLRQGPWPPPGADRLVRAYWNCPPLEAHRLVAGLSALFSSHEVPFVLKTPAGSTHHGRADALVLYLGSVDYARHAGALRALALSLRTSLRGATPRLTLSLAPGLGVAEGPLEGTSFGEARCRTVAAAFASAAGEVRESASRLARRVGEAFWSAGLDPARPYLEPGGCLEHAR